MTNGNKIPNLNAVRGEITEALAPVQAAADSASNALGNLTLAELSARADGAGPQLVDGDRWVYEATGAADGRMIVPASGGGVWRREADRVQMRYFGARAGQENTQAWADAIEYANARGGAVTFLVGEGRYDVYNGAALPNITAPRVGWRGVGESTMLNFYGGEALKWNGVSLTNQVIGGGLADMTLAYLSPGSEVDSVIARLRHTSGQRFSNLTLEQVRCLIAAGEGYEGYLGPSNEQLYRNTGEAFNIRVSGVTGGKRNDGRPLFNLLAGFGFSLSGANLFVSGVLTPERGGPIDTVADTDMIRLDQGRWDTLEVEGGLYERFSRTLYAHGRVHLPKLNLRLAGISADYNADEAILLETDLGAAIANVKLFTPYVTSWRASGIVTRGQGAIYNMALESPQPHLCAESGMNLGGIVKRLSIEAPMVHGTGMVTPSAPAVVLGAGLSDWTLRGGVINPDATDEGITFRSTVGLAVAANADRYLIDTQAHGALPYLIEANTTGSSKRRIRGNIADAIPTYTLPAVPASGGAWTNPTPYQLALSIIGGTTVAVRRNDIPVAAGGEITVRPGDVLKMTYDTVPDWVAAVVA